MTDLGTNLIRERDGKCLRATGRRRICERVQQVSGYAKLHERVFEFVPLTEETAVQDESVGRHLREIFSG